MPTRRDMDRVQIPMDRELGRLLKKLAVDMQPRIERDRAMDRGPMIAYLARWFHSLPFARQVEIIAAGKALTDADADAGAMVESSAISNGLAVDAEEAG